MEQAWQDFGQKVDLTARLREILINYPEGTSILKEIVQNADDAKATTVKFCLDHNTYPSGSVLSPQIGQFQGPALLSYNDGVFSEKDFESISRIGDSKKREQIGKTGRFGVGFNAIYHLTDVPSFVSGQHLVVFDPHCKHLPAVSSANPGKKINFVEHDIRSTLADQTAPYQLFGCNARSYFAGTLFRFPLRTHEQADASSISKQVYTTDKISALFADLQQEAHLVLLFLKSICSIDVLELRPGQQEPQLLFSCSIANATKKVLQQRALFLHAAGAPADEEVAGTYQLEMISKNATAETTKSTSYLISQRRGTAQLLTMAEELSRQFQVPLVPWAAVAAELCTSNGSSSSESASMDDATAGRAFCFLPLPAMTGLPVHINGYFELSSNRRDVWHGKDMAGAGRLRAQWNKALLQLVVAPAYLDLLAAAAKFLGHGAEYTRLWPSIDALEPWQGVVRQLYGNLANKPLLWTAAGGGRWLPISQCLFPDAVCLHEQPLHLLTAAEAQQQQRQHATDHVRQQQVARGSIMDSKAPGLGPMGQALLLLDMPLLDMPAAVLIMMQKYLPELPHMCTPAAARAAVAAHSSRTAVLQREAQLVPLLAYCLADIDLSAGPEACKHLLGLRLLPLSNGSLAEFAALASTGKQQQQQQQLVFVVTQELELSIIGSQKHLLLDHELVGPALTAHLSLAASYACLNVQLLTVRHLVNSILPQLIPATWNNATVVEWHSDTTAGECGGTTLPVTWEWLQSFWQWIATKPQEFPLLLSTRWPLLPVLANQLVPLKPLPASAVIAPSVDNWPDGLAAVLMKLGCFVLDTGSFELPVEALMKDCVHRPGGVGVAAAICAVLGWQAGVDAQSARQQQQQQQQQQQLKAEEISRQLTAADARQLRSFLLQQRWFSRVGQDDVAALLHALRHLPLFELANSRLVAARDAPRQQQQQQVQAEQAVARVTLEAGSCLAPAGVYTAALDSRFLKVSSDQEAAVLVQQLGVAAPTAAHVYLEVILPQLEVLPEAVRDTAMLRMLRMLPDLQQQDKTFARALSKIAFVPNNAGQLKAPSELYDPRSPELVALLDPNACFPAPHFCGDFPDGADDDESSTTMMTASDCSAGFSCLAALQQLGLRGSADLGTLVLAAHYVDQTARDGDMDMAVARGKALLSYLDTEAERLVGRHTAITCAAAAAIAAAAAQETGSSAGGSRRPSNSSSENEGYEDSREPKKRRRPGFFSAVKSLWGLGSKGQSEQQQADKISQLSFISSGTASVVPEGAVQAEAAEQQPTAAQATAGQWAELARTCWCPILSASPDAALPWKAESVPSESCTGTGAERGGSRQMLLAAPCAARPRGDLWLVSSVMNVVDGDCRSPVLLAGLGWSAPLPGAVLATQLSAIGATNRHVQDAGKAQKLARIVPVLYGALAGLSQQELAAAAAVLEGRPTVWVGNGFVPAERVAFKGGLDLSPHLYVLPLELSPFRELMAVLGAQEAFSAAQYTTLLQDLGREAAGKPLAPQQLAQALAVVQALADVVGASGGGATAGRLETGGKQQEVLLVPDDQGVLRPAAELAFDDAPWLEATSTGLDSELHLVHPRVSAPVAEALGVASRRRLMLAASADCLALGLAGAGGDVEAFGQSEALTTRLRHIIQDYPEGPGILLELVQNADDAGASKAAFLLDARQHGTSSLLGPGMAAWQGPALLAYNDATFSPGDFAAIARIGQDGKMAQPAAIGRFGLGFNAVYHLTDLPSFVSGQHLVLFDPHAKYLPGASAAQPGLRVNINRGGGRLIRQFPDAFAPYMHFGCTMEGSYPGTLFRFPLRSGTTSAMSDIKSNATTAAQALELLQSLSHVLPQALLFLKSLKHIEVYVIGDAAAPDKAAEGGPGELQQTGGQQEQPRLLFKANLAALDGAGPLQQPILKFVSSGGAGSGAQQLDAFYRRLATTPEQELPSSIGRVQLMMTVPASAAATADAAARVGASEPTVLEVLNEQWLVCNQLGGGDARALALKAWKEDKVKMVPWVGVAARLSQSSGASSLGGRAFCFLPLPAVTGLPVHINGYFELSSNRRDVWHGKDMAGAGRLRAEWNEALLSAAVAPAYASLLLEAAQLLGPIPDVWNLLPSGQGTVHDPWLRVSAALYAQLASKAVLWSPVGQGSWLTPQHTLLPDEACFNHGSSTAAGAAAEDVHNSSDACGAPGMIEDSAASSSAFMGHVGRPEGASLLSQLLVSCGVPLVVAVTQEQQRCLLSWTPRTQQISPALARRLLASNATQLSRYLTKQQHQQHRGQHPAAVLLQYCLSDVDVTSTDSSSTTSPSRELQAVPGHAINASSSNGPQVPTELLAAIRQFNGLPLLPAADGSLQVIRFASQHAQSSSSGSGTGTAQLAKQVVYVPCSPQECKLLDALPDQLLHPSVESVLQQQLLLIAAAGVSNIRLLTCKNLDEQVLPQLLPLAWYGQLEVRWRQPGSTVGSNSNTSSEAARVQGTSASSTSNQQDMVGQLPADPGHFDDFDNVVPLSPGADNMTADGDQPDAAGATSRDFIKLLWQWMADRSDVADLAHWPVLPVAGGRLRLLQQPAQVLQGGDWTEQLTSALCKLGCCLLDTSVINPSCPALAPFVQQPTAAGLLDALSAVQAMQAAAEAQQRLGVQPRAASTVLMKGSGMKRYQHALQDLTAAERHHLRTYLLQQKWFVGANAGLTKHHLQQLTWLPVFEVHPRLPYEDAVAPQQMQRSPAAGAAKASSSGQAQHVQLALPGQPPQLLLPPAGISSQVLGSRFLRCESDIEADLLTNYLGVQRLALSSFLSDHLATAPWQLDRRGLVNSMVYVLQNVKQLVLTDHTLPSVLRGLPVIPTRESDSSAQLHLAAPSALFDPRNPAFRQLLDPLKHFPAAPFDGSAENAAAAGGAAGAEAVMSAQLLDGLVICGLRTELDLEVLVIAAESIAKYASDDPSPHRRAEALLQQLKRWAQQHPQPTEQEQSLIKILQGTPWCPVLLLPPNPALPWPHDIPAVLQEAASQGAANASIGFSSRSSSEDGSRSSRDSGSSASMDEGASDPAGSTSAAIPVLRIAPKLIAPAEMAWLVSAPLRLLAGHHQTSRQLRVLMGWSVQQVLRPSVAIAQLMELGKMYPAGSVQDAGLQADIEKAAGVLYSCLSAREADQHQLLEMTLTVTPSVWTGNGFAYPAVTALNSTLLNSVHATATASAEDDNGLQSRETTDTAVSSSSLQQQLQQQQLLWVVPAAIIQDHPSAEDTLLAIGVQPVFEFAAYAIALAVLAERSAGAPLGAQQLSLAIALAEAAGQALLSGTGSVRQLQQPGVMQAATALQAQAAAAAGSSRIRAAGGAEVLLLPDGNGLMALPSDLYFNDAAWLDVEGLRFAHPGLSQATCEALGVRSMRYQHEVNTQLTANIPCPTIQDAAAAAATILAACSAQQSSSAAASIGTKGVAAGSSDTLVASASTAATTGAAVRTAKAEAFGPVTTVLLAVLAWADQLRQGTSGQCSSMRVVLDERQHGKESLLHPGLAKLQGPALCISLQGLSLPAGQLQQLLTPRPKKMAGRPGAAGMEAACEAAAVQLGLTSVWAVADICQVMSGDTTCYWDPSGSALAQTAAELRSPAPRGRSVRHTQPGVVQRFADQWSVWQPCSMNFSSAASAAATTDPGTEAADAIFVRMPLRLQDQGLHGSGLAAAVGDMLGHGGWALSLRLEDVRRQVAAFCAVATRSLLFLGHVQQVSVGHWGSNAAASPARLWQGSLLPHRNGGLPLRTGLLAEHTQTEASKPAHGGNVLHALLNRGGSKRTSYKNCWPMTLQVVSNPSAIAQVAPSHPEAPMGLTNRPVGHGTGDDATPPLTAPVAAIAPGGIAGSEDGNFAVQPSMQQQQQGAAEDPIRGAASSRVAAMPVTLQTATVAADASQGSGSIVSNNNGSASGRGSNSSSTVSSSSVAASGVVCQDYTFMVSAVCEMLPEGAQTGAYSAVEPLSAQGVSAALSAAAGAAGLKQFVPRTGSSSSSSGHGEGSKHPVFVTSAVAVCIKQGGIAAQPQVTPTGGVFSGVALPSRGLLSMQNFLVSMHSEPSVAVPARPPRESSLLTASLAAAATAPALQQQQHQYSSAATSPVQQLMMSRVVTAWQELVVMLNNMRVPGLYCLVPDLVAAVEAGDTDTAAVFKSMLQGVASLPIWQLHSGRLAHLQEGAFLPPRELDAPSTTTQQQQLQQQSGGEANNIPQGQLQIRQQGKTAGVTGLADEARQFITRHLPLFNVPWSVVRQLEAAGIPGLRIVSPNVLRPLLCRLGEKPLAPGEPHPFYELTPTQALQLLEFCCSDLLAAGCRGSSETGMGADSGGLNAAQAVTGLQPSRAGAAAAAAAGGSAAAGATDDVMLSNLPDGAAALVGEVLGPGGLTVLRGLANQLQAQVTRGIDDVLNTVIEAMNEGGVAGGGQRQQQQATGAAAAAAAAPGTSSSSYQQQRESVPDPAAATSEVPVFDMKRVKWLRGLPIPTAAGTVAVLGTCILYVCPDSCRPAPHSLLPTHLLKQFVSEECVSALAWALQHAELRQELNLVYYGFQHLAVHLKDVLGQTWEFAEAAGVGSRSSNSSSRLMPGTNGAAAVTASTDTAAAAVPWNDGAAGGPYFDWLQRLWQVMLHIIAAAPSWQVDRTTWTRTAGSSSSTAAHTPTVAQRARQVLVNADAAAAAAAAQFLGTGGLAAFGGPIVNPEAAAAAAATAAADDDGNGAPTAEDLMWQPLADWPLLPLADGRLLRLKHRQLVLAVLPEYKAASQQGSAAESWADGLQEPWSWLLAAAMTAGLPLLDPRFNSICTAGTGPMAAEPARTAISMVPAGGTAAAEGHAVLQPPGLPVERLLGPQPLIGRPPFLGPLVRKLQGAQQHLLGKSIGLRAWDDAVWEKLFVLFADHPPRDLQPSEVHFLRQLPMYKRLPVAPTCIPGCEQVQQMHEDYVGVVGMKHLLRPCDGEGGSEEAALPTLVALGEESRWVLAPESLVRSCAAILALPTLPNGATRHLLEHRANWGELYHIVGLEPTNMAGLLKGLLLPNLLRFSQADRKIALNFILRSWNAAANANLSQNGEFVQALSAIAFVPARVLPATAAGSAAAARLASTTGDHSSSSSAGNCSSSGTVEQTERLYLAKQLFDPSVPLFAKVMDIVGVDVQFPAAPYNQVDWLQVLRTLGLQSQVTPETCLQLAQHIAASAAALAAATPASSCDSSTDPAAADTAGYTDVSKADSAQVARLVSAADALLTTLRSKSAVPSFRPFWQGLGSARFVPATVGLPGSRSCRQVFASCASAAQQKDWHLVWSVMPVLSEGRSLPSMLAQLMGMRSPPPLSAVLQHLNTVGADGGEDLLASWPDGLEPITELTIKVLEHLDREGLSKNQAQLLSSAAFMPVAHGSRLVAPQQLFIRLSGAALAPFIWEVPGQYVGKLELLQQLGVKEEPRAEDLVQALQRFELQLAGRRMNPNELSASLRLLAFLSSRSSARDATYLASARRSSAALLVPTAGALLMPASRVVHVGNAGGGVAAARLLGRADPQHLVLAHPQLSDHICRWLGVASLADVLAEELDPSVKLVPVPVINSTSLEHLQLLLASPHFASSVFSIAAAHAAAVPGLRQLSLGSVSHTCASAAAAGKLVLVEKLATRVVLRGSGKDVTRDTASRQVYEFYDSNTGTMYVAVPPPGLALSSLLAQVLSRALGSPFTLPLHPLLEVPDAQALTQLQAVLHSGGYDQELEGALASGHVGSPVQPADRTLLRLRPLRNYSAGEVVAFKRRSNAAGIASSGLNTGSGTAAAGMAGNTAANTPAEVGNTGDGVVLCYARVAVDAAPAPGQAAYRLSVEVAPGMYETLLSTQVFCFQSGAHGAAAVAGLPQRTSAASSSAAAGDSVVEAAAGQGIAGGSVLGSSSTAGGSSAGQQMAASELASAVADMLTAAGMPLDLDRQQLLQKALAADQQLSQATAAIAELRQEAQRKEQELDAMKSSWQCRVCFSRDVNQAFVGCGHMYCSSCMPSLAKCPVCRTASAKIKLYR